MHTYSGRVALVTGGSRGAGRGICERLGALGAKVAINYRRDDEAARLAVEAITQAGGTARSYCAPVDDQEAVATMVESITAELGVIDVLVSNAGIASTGRSVTDSTDDEYRRLWNVHVGGLINTARAILPGMRAIGGGDIVVISSDAVTATPPATAPYVAAKAALESVARVLAFEERPHNIRVNIAAPGLLATEMGDRLVAALVGESTTSAVGADYPFGRVCTPEDVANAVAFLASPQASYITGQRLAIHGGGAIEPLVSFNG